MNTPTTANPARTSESASPKFTMRLPCAATGTQPCRHNVVEIASKPSGDTLLSNSRPVEITRINLTICSVARCRFTVRSKRPASLGSIRSYLGATLGSMVYKHRHGVQYYQKQIYPTLVCLPC